VKNPKTEASTNSHKKTVSREGNFMSVRMKFEKLGGALNKDLSSDQEGPYELKPSESNFCGISQGFSFGNHQFFWDTMKFLI